MCLCMFVVCVFLSVGTQNWSGEGEPALIISSIIHITSITIKTIVLLS